MLAPFGSATPVPQSSEESAVAGEAGDEHWKPIDGNGQPPGTSSSWRQLVPDAVMQQYPFEPSLMAAGSLQMKVGSYVAIVAPSVHL